MGLRFRSSFRHGLVTLTLVGVMLAIALQLNNLIVKKVGLPVTFRPEFPPYNLTHSVYKVTQLRSNSNDSKPAFLPANITVTDTRKIDKKSVGHDQGYYTE